MASGALALVALDALVSSPETGRIGDLFAVPGAVAQWLIDPGKVAIPDLSGAGSSTPSAGAPSTPPATYKTPSKPPAPSAPKPTYHA